MEKEHNLFTWKIAWESLPKYKGHKIYNCRAKEIAMVNWDAGGPRLLDKEGNEIICCYFDFIDGYKLWEYKVGEIYL